MGDEHTAASCTEALQTAHPPPPTSKVGTPSKLPPLPRSQDLPIKRGDAEPLTREDLQYDLLYYIFADRTVAFVDFLAPGKPLVNFCDLYVNALYNSSKCSKVLKDKMVETPAFAIEFAKISLLTNVGRINTTMAFFPEMKTALRSYHPVPSLQKTDGNLQDAPRIKNCLKAALLPSEFKGTPPSSPLEILEKARAGQIPPTSVVNLIFVLANSNNSQQIAHSHFDPPVEFLDLFLPVNLSSNSRAKAFLWLMFHYLQGPDKPNPFDDDYSRANPGKVPRLRHLTPEEMARENVDPADEIEWGRRMSTQRSKFLKELVDEMEAEKKKAREPQPAPMPAPTTSTFSDAWHIAASTDPLNDSDEEQDEHVRLDYNRRLRVLSRLRGKEPTPEPESEPVAPPSGMQPSQQFTQQTTPPSGSDGATGRLSQVQSWR
ncbi:hypothetical protein EVJ58_g4032 [Rhodofomes roseus]|uniref:Ino eighty subunit 1 n=1 Tax=Rhodofomes roseus TaxID=34475 RepID=A0A4Y9YHY0_9APHY|nr:hypothetical protein EVJ58_g4032 [Rhodofomes roseus]